MGSNILIEFSRNVTILQLLKETEIAILFNETIINFILMMGRSKPCLGMFVPNAFSIMQDDSKVTAMHCNWICGLCERDCLDTVAG